MRKQWRLEALNEAVSMVYFVWYQSAASAFGSGSDNLQRIYAAKILVSTPRLKRGVETNAIRWVFSPRLRRGEKTPYKALTKRRRIESYIEPFSMSKASFES